MKEKKEIQIGVYRIDKNLFNNKTEGEIVDLIIESYNKKVSEDKKFHVQKTNQKFTNFEVKIFFSKKTQPPKWRSFLSNILEDSSPLLKGFNTDVSYIAFIYNKDNLFAISGGQGNFTVQEYIDQNFGIEILTRLISKDSKVIKSLQDRCVTSSILGSTKFFRGDYKFSDEDEFGKIYKQIKAELNRDILCEEFGFSDEEISKNAGCLAKSSFQINKSINFETLLRIIEKLSDILKNQKPLFSLNKVLLISRRGKANKELVKKLEQELNKKLFNYCTNSEEIDFDFCHPNFDNYLMAENYKVYKGNSKNPIFESSETLDDVKYLLDQLKNKEDISIKNEEEFSKSLENINIVSYNAEGKRSTWKKFICHVHGELLIDGKTYFFIDNEWYAISSDFITELNDDCKYSISNALNQDILPNNFDEQKNENEYNQLYLGKDGYLVLDKIISENIEMCDILKFSDNKIYLIHVKKAFDNSVRELIAQTLISAKRLIRDRKTDKSYLRSVQKCITEGTTRGNKEYSEKIKKQNIPSEGLDGLFNNKKDSDIIFCLGILDTSSEERNFSDDIKKYKSNIAKFSILELEKNLRGLGLGFAIIHVKKQTY